MINLRIKQSSNTPSVDFQLNGDLFISGISTPDNVTEFYNPLFEWLKKFKELKKKITFSLFFNYLNTSSTRILVDLILNLQSLNTEEVNVTFVWKYEEDDIDMLELGEDIEMVTNIKFEYQLVSVD